VRGNGAARTGGGEEGTPCPWMPLADALATRRGNYRKRAVATHEVAARVSRGGATGIADCGRISLARAGIRLPRTSKRRSTRHVSGRTLRTESFVEFLVEPAKQRGTLARVDADAIFAARRR
jgi:hypothetical protein